MREKSFTHTDAVWLLCSRWLENPFGNRRNCSKWAISPFASMFSTLFNYHTFIYRYFSYFRKDVFEVFCCRFIVCIKGFNWPFPSYRRLWCRRLFENNDGRRNCLKQAISPFATMFSLLVIGYRFNYRDFLFFDKIYLKSSLYIPVCGKGLKEERAGYWENDFY